MAVVTWQKISPYGTTVLGWMAALCVIVSVALGMVALSDRRGRRGKWLGLLSMLLGLVSMIAFVGRMTP